MGVIIRNSFKTTIINYIGVIIGAISLLLIQTTILTDAQIGEVKLLVDKAVLVMPFIVVGMSSVASRFFFHFDKDKQSHDSFISMLIAIPFLLFVVVFSMFYFFNSYFGVSHVVLIGTLLFTYVYLSIFEAYLTTKAKIIFPAVIRNIVFKVVYLIVLALFYYDIISFRNILVLFGIMHLLHLLLIVIHFKNNLSFKFNFNFSFYKHPKFKEIITFCLFMILGTGSLVLVTKLDTVMLEGITNNRGFVGVYTIALSIAAFIDMPRKPLVQLSIPILAKDIANNEMDKVDVLYKKSALNLMIIGATLFSLIWINIDFIFSVIPQSETYRTGKYVVFFLGLSKLFDLALGLNGEVIHNSKYYKWNLVLLPFLAILTIVLNIYFINKYQSIASAAMATLVSFAIYNVLRTILVKVKLNLLPFSKQYFYAIPFIFIPFLIECYLIPSEINIWLKMLIDSSLVLIFFCLPVYFLKISGDINEIVNTLLRKYLKLKI